MNDEALSKIMAEIEDQIGPERLSAIRRLAARKGVSVLKLLGDAVAQYADRLAHPTPTKVA